MVLKRVLVTGASGMVGRQVVAALAAEKAEVVATSRTRLESLPQGATWAPWDLGEWRTPAELGRLFGAVDAAVHCGAAVPRAGLRLDDRQLIDVNVRACLALGEWALSMDAPVVFVSGAAVYAEPERSGIAEDAPKGPNAVAGFYGVTKLMAEAVFGMLRRRGLKAAILRPSSIYGPGLADGKMIAEFMAVAARGGAIALEPPVDDRVDLVHAGDVARAALLALTRQAWEDFNVASGKPVSVAEIAAACVRAAGRGSVQLPPAPGGREPVVRFGLDTARARRQLGYAPAISLDAGLAMMRAGAPRLRATTA